MKGETRPGRDLRPWGGALPIHREDGEARGCTTHMAAKGLLAAGVAAPAGKGPWKFMLLVVITL